MEEPKLTEVPQTQPKPRKRSVKFIVPVLLLVGAVMGLVSALNLQREFPRNGFPPIPGFGYGPFEYLQYHIVLSTVSLVLLLALIVVYSRSYIQTRANFMLGLLVVLFALLLEGLLRSPLLHLYLIGSVEIDAFYSPVSDVFTIVAYSVFLYLSLE